MVERSEDSSGQSNIIAGAEKQTFQRLLTKFGLKDSRYLAEDLWGPNYSRYQVVQDNFKWSVLDRLYFSQGGNWIPQVLALAHHADFDFTDHFPVSIVISLQDSLPPPTQNHHSYFKLDPTLLNSPQIIHHLELLWTQLQAEPHPTIEDYLSVWEKQMQYLQQQQQIRDTSISNILMFEQLLADYHLRNDDSAAATQRIQVLKQQLEEARQLRDHKIRLWSRTRHLGEGDASTPYFHRQFKKRISASTIKTLRTEDGRTLEEPGQILHQFQQSFCDLYSPYRHTDQSMRDLHQLLQHVPSQLTSTQQLFLHQQPTILEVSDSVYTMPLNRAPGLDAFTAESFRKIWPFFNSSFYIFIHHFWALQFLPSQFASGIIKLLPKHDINTTVADFCPITLLSLHYKVIAKIFALRLAVLLPTIVPTHQSGFVRGRSTADNIYLLLAVHDYLKINHRSAAFIQLDLAKAYDKISDDSMYLILAKIGCSTQFINLVRGLTIGATATIHLHGQFSLPINLNRGVRQGCCLAPLLFAIITIPVILRLQAAADSGHIKALHLHNNKNIITAWYADDAAVYVEFDHDSFSTLADILQQFCSATGSSISFPKSMVRSIGTTAEMPAWISLFNYRIVQPSQITRYLGLFFAPTATAKQMWDYSINKLSDRLQAWNDKYIRFEGRVTLLKTVLFAIPSYTLNFLFLSAQQSKSIQRLILNFLWGFSDQGKPKVHLVNAAILSLPLESGGLQLSSLQTSNTAALAKAMLCFLLESPAQQWMAVVEDFWSSPRKPDIRDRILSKIQVSTSAKSLPGRLLQAWNQIHHQLRFQVRQTFNFWVPDYDNRFRQQINAYS
ncbi:hypothetical protein R1sor_025463 [Riccia sorocarpa]|uniref:Reverse transcriptase domain-containing protein n=1 Tax=Riccia sorocarpa TaxID=122646 RepID=A0ABD3GBS0_9MARC